MRLLLLTSALAFAACGTAAPISDVTDAASLETYLESRNLQVVERAGPAATDRDPALGRALVASYTVTGTQPPTRTLDPTDNARGTRIVGQRPAGPAAIDLYAFETAEETDAGIDALQRSRLFGEIYVRDGLVLAVTGNAATLRLALARAFGTPVQA